MRTRLRNIARFGAGWKFRVGIPPDLVEAFGGKQFLTKYVRARTEAQVIPIRDALMVHHKRLFGEVRRAPADAKEVIARFKGDMDAIRGDLKNLQIGRLFVAAAAGAVGGEVDLTQAPEAVVAHLSAKRDFEGDLAAMDRDIAVRQTILVMGETEAPEGSLAAVHGLWVHVNAPRSKSVISRRKVWWNEFLKAAGLDPRDHVKTVTAAHVRKYRDWIETLNTSHNDKVGRLGAIKGMLSICKDRAWTDDMPGAGITVAAAKGLVTRDMLRRAFRPDELKAFLDVVDGVQAKTPRGNPARIEESKVAIRLLAHTGARPGEIVRLRASDIYDVDGIRAMRITVVDGKLKTATSYRVIPVPLACVDAVNRYAAGKSGDEPLFTEYAKYSHREAFLCKHGGVALRAAGVTDPHVVVYSLRHTYKKHAEDIAEVPAHILWQLQGHEVEGGSKASNRYSQSPSPMTLLAKWQNAMDHVPPPINAAPSLPVTNVTDND